MNVVMRMNISEMPTACGPCELSCTAICKEWTKVDRKEIGRTKSSNCPIIAILPEGHGRLVDADLFKRQLQTAWAIDEISYAGLRDMMRRLNDEPTIVPADTAERSET